MIDLIDLDDGIFRTRFAGTPVKRTGRDRFIRNVLIAAGNSGDSALVSPIVRLLDDMSPLVRAMAVWALARLSPDEAERQADNRKERETDEAVTAEWAAIT